MSVIWHYIILSIVISFLIGCANKYAKPLYPKMVVLGVRLVLISFIINIVYTGILGWHAQAVSPLERVLDIIDGIFFGIGWMILAVLLSEAAIQKLKQKRGR